MRSAGSQKNYKFGQKNNWRRTVWNDVLRRTDGREKVEPILYLAGPQDIDRSIATDKGVPDQNLIAIDRELLNVNRVRSVGSPAVQGDLMEVLASWPQNRPVCAVMMDFCCGLTMDAVDVYDILERKPFRDAAVMINLQRGRDPWSNEMRSRLGGASEEDFDMLMAVSTWAYGPTGPSGAECLSDKHRALIWLVFHAMDAWQSSASPSLMGRIRSTPGYEEGFEDAVGMMWAGNYFKSARPHFRSYKSGVLTFDSVVLSNPVGVLYSLGSDDDRKQYDAVSEERHAHARRDDTARRISAMLAIRTRRLAS